MKNLKTLAAIAFAAVLFIGCEKEETQEPINQKSIDVVQKDKVQNNKTNYNTQIQLNYEDIYNTYSLNDFKGLIEWKREQNGSVLSKLISLKFEDFDSITVINKGSDFIDLKMGSDTIFFDEIVNTDNTIIFENSKSNMVRIIEGNVSSDEINFNNMFSNILVNDSYDPFNDPSDPGDTELNPLAILFGLAVLTSAAIDYLCDQQIAAM